MNKLRDHGVKILKWILELVALVLIALSGYLAWSLSLPAIYIAGIIGVVVLTTAVLTLLIQKVVFPREVTLQIARWAWGWDGGDIPASFFIALTTLLIGIVFGVWAYTDRVNHFQNELVKAYAKADVVSALLAAEPGAYTAPNAPLQDQYLYLVLRRLGLLSRDELRKGPQAVHFIPGDPANEQGLPNREVAKIVFEEDFKKLYKLGQPTLDLFIALGLGTMKGLALPASEMRWTRLALANLLARVPAEPGWSPGLQRESKLPDRCYDKPTAECLEQAEKEITKLAIPFDRGLIMHRPPELTPFQIAAELHRWVQPDTDISSGAPDADKLATNEAVPRFQAALLDALRNDTEVREARMWLNAFVGPERLLIFILAFWFIALTLVRAVQALPHNAHDVVIHDAFKKFKRDWRSGGTEAGQRYNEANTLLEHLSGGALSHPRLITIPSRLLEAALEEMASRVAAGKTESSRPSDSQAIETASKGLLEKLSHSRLILDALLPTFPAIGFVGTVTSLLIAMSQADQIVKATDALGRGTATAAVTDVLSLCFAATLMALICLIVLGPLDQWQSARERRLVTRTEHLLQDVLKPEQT